MSESLFPTPAVPETARTPLSIAAQSAAFARQELARTLERCGRELSPAALDEVVRLMNAATHLRDSIKALLPL